MDKIIRGIIELNAVDFDGAGIGSLVYFTLLCLLFVLAPLTSLCCVKWDIWRVCSLIFQLLVASLYYFGDNIDYFASVYGEAFECDLGCQQMLVVVKQVFLGVAIVFIHTIPFLDHEPHLDEKRSVCYVLNIVNVLVKVDMIYSIVTTTIILPGGDCSVTKTLSFTFFCLATVIGWVSILRQRKKGAAVIFNKDEYKSVYRNHTNRFGVSLLLVSLPLFLLADNQQPLQCGLLNTTYAARGNRTVGGDMYDYNTTVLSSLRLVFTIITAICVGITFVIVTLKTSLDHQHKETTL